MRQLSSSAVMRNGAPAVIIAFRDFSLRVMSGTASADSWANMCGVARGFKVMEVVEGKAVCFSQSPLSPGG